LSSNFQGSNRWYALTLSTLTIGLGFALPTMCMPVLFKEISEEFALNLVQVGVIWGSISLAGVLACLIGGVLGDRFGLKRTIIISCILTGLTGAMRGLANDYISLIAASFLFSFISSIVMINTPKVSKIWFSKQNFGLSNGIQATGMSLGFTLSAMVSATVLSPWLGGWRNVLYLYGLITVIMGVLWLLTIAEPKGSQATDSPSALPIRQSILHVSHIREVWLLGLALAGYVGCLQGVIGYLPLYLRNIGWSPVGADGALAAFNIASAFGPVPLTLLSDRLGRRKLILILLLVMAVIGTCLLAFFTNELVWVMSVMIGFTRDAVMTLFIIMTMELKGVDLAYTGTAMGLLQTLSRIGAVASPPLGNGMAGLSSGAPYFFWAGLGILGLAIFLFVKETGHSHPRTNTGITTSS
jgi:MFS family permease